MKIKLYVVFAIVGIASGIVALVRLGFGQDAQDVVPPNIVIGGVCVVMMVLLSYKEWRQIARRN